MTDNAGPIKFGSLPLYQVPKLLLNLVNFNEPTIMDYVTPLPDLRVRPLPGLHFNLLADGKIDLCAEPHHSEACALSCRWLQDVSVVGNDLFIGRQFTRPKHPPAESVKPSSDEIAPVQAGDSKGQPSLFSMP